MAPTPDELQKQWERSTALHDKYRAAGLALTVLIVTVSAAAINAIRPQGWLGLFMFLPIALAIVHQACLYFGQQSEAWGSWRWFVVSKSIRDKATAITPVIAEQAEEAQKRAVADGWRQRDRGTFWFKAADVTCAAAVVAFVAVGLFVSMNLPPVPPK
jgi:hypothetical protein